MSVKVFRQAMQQYWMSCGFTIEPPFLCDVKGSGFSVSFLDFTQSLASSSAPTPIKKIVRLASTNEEVCEPFNMVVLDLMPVLVPVRRMCRLGAVEYRDFPDWFGRGVVFGAEAGTRVTVKFVIAMLPGGDISRIHFDLDFEGNG